MPTSFSHIVLFLVTLPLPLLQLLQNCYWYVCDYYCYFHTTLLLNTLLQMLSCPGVVELTTQLLILENILWLPLCRINKFGLNTLPSKTVAIPYTCGLSTASSALGRRAAVNLVRWGRHGGGAEVSRLGRRELPGRRWFGAHEVWMGGDWEGSGTMFYGCICLKCEGEL